MISSPALGWWPHDSSSTWLLLMEDVCSDLLPGEVLDVMVSLPCCFASDGSVLHALLAEEICKIIFDLSPRA